MGLPILDGCCCCCKLKTGVMVLAVLSLIGAILNIISYATGAEDRKMTTALQDLGYDSNSINNIVLAVTVIAVIMNIVYACISVLLLQGIRKDNTKFMKPYFIWACISVGLIVVSCVVILIVFFNNVAVVGVYIGMMAVIVLIQLYFIWVVYSYIKTVERQNSSGTMKMEETY